MEISAGTFSVHEYSGGFGDNHIFRYLSIAVIKKSEKESMAARSKKMDNFFDIDRSFKFAFMSHIFTLKRV